LLSAQHEAPLGISFGLHAGPGLSVAFFSAPAGFNKRNAESASKLNPPRMNNNIRATAANHLRAPPPVFEPTSLPDIRLIIRSFRIKQTTVVLRRPIGEFIPSHSAEIYFFIF
jgi:hypothetical protein